jgi:HSP20 family protein
MSQQLEPWRPWLSMTPWRDMEERMERLFAEFTGRPFLSTPTESPWLPAVEVVEKDGTLIAKADLPGLKREDITVSVVGQTLTIAGERKSETETKEATYYRCERSYGSFRRMLTLPEAVDPTRITATYTDGVLEVTMPITKKEGPKTISVQ